jgi:beta-glucosidase/6-phospho-beta-glucosidase/beta-galactosidase
MTPPPVSTEFEFPETASEQAQGQTFTQSADTPDTAQEFVWGAGIECTFIPHLRVDQFEWTQHNRFWRDDFKRLREELGVSAMRYALPWHQIETEPGKFDFSIADERLGACQEMGIDVHLDLMHFGTPLWLSQAAGDPQFPESLERFADAMASRYRDVVKKWCPCNEPLVLALFSGDFGFWPPHARQLRGYMPVLSRVVQGASRAMSAIRRVQPDATLIWCDHVENYHTFDEALQDEVWRRNQRRFLAMDLVTGRVDRHHALFQWLTSYGMSELDLEWFAHHPQTPDIMGLDYYPNSEWQLEDTGSGPRQRHSETPAGLYGVSRDYYNRYGIPLMLTETSIDGQPLNREIWLDQTVEDCRRLREEGIPMHGYFWWPMIDQVDWDGALTHRVGKIHQVGLFTLTRQPDGTLARSATPLARQFARIAGGANERVGEMAPRVYPTKGLDEDQSPLIATGFEAPGSESGAADAVEVKVAVPPTARGARSNGNGNGNGNGHATKTIKAPRISSASSPVQAEIKSDDKSLDRYGIVVFSHLRWGFVWQRPQQFLSRFAKRHNVLFFEEPFFDVPEGSEARLDYHRVMPNVTVVTPHVPMSWNRNPQTPQRLLEFAKQAIARLNQNGEFDRPLLWYYSPMDSAWSLGQIENRGVVYDCMDELSQFSGAPTALVDNERRLIDHADVVFCGGLELAGKKKQVHDNVHMFGCGVEFGHFNKAAAPHASLPPDIDFMARPILGWFGVIDERVDYGMIGQMAKLRPDWSFAMIGPVVKVDPNHLPHAPNLFWMGNRDYQQLPDYCAAFDVCMMCFAINRATEYINPTKGLEYMATGKPIVSTPVRDVVNQWSDIVRIASGAEAFIAAADDALGSGRNDPRVLKGLELAKKSSWDSTVMRMEELIKQAISPRDRRSAKPIPPVQAMAEYVYCATQGS